MKFETTQESLIKVLSKLVRNTNQTTEIYKFIQIEPTSDDLITLKSNNGTTLLSCKLPALNVSGNAVMIEAKKFFEVINKLKGNIVFNNGEISCANSLINLEIIDDTYFQQENEEIKNETDFNLKEFKNVVKNRLFACDVTGHHILSAICINKDDVVSTDGNKLSLGKLKDSTNFDNLMLNKFFVEEMIKNFDTDIVKISDSSKKIIISDKSTVMSCLKINGTYPPYKDILPNYSNGFCIDKQKMIEALELILTITNDRTNLCILDITQNNLTLKAANEKKSGQTIIDIDYTGEAVKIGMNALYLIAAIKNTNEDKININFEGSLTPFVVKTKDDLNVLMPVQLKGIQQ